jgi:GT2 family glycosyltransferase
VDYIRKEFPEVILISSDRNVGFCVSNNRMVAQASGEYILLLNNDAKLFPNALRALHDHTAATGHPAGILGLPQYDATTGELIDFGNLLDPFLNVIPNLDPQRCEVGSIIGACLWIPKSLWTELGGFPNCFGFLAEDLYLCCAARLRGYYVRILPTSGFWHHIGYSLGGGKLVNKRLLTSRARRSLTERNKCYVMIVTYPPLLFWTLFPLHILLLTSEGIALSLVKRDLDLWRSIYWHCLRSLWRNRRLAYRMRKRLQSTGGISAREFTAPFVYIHQKLWLIFRHGLPEIR